jgi:hypothetical protein
VGCSDHVAEKIIAWQWGGTLPALSVESGWVFHVSGGEIANTLQRAGAQVVSTDPLDYAFISFA